MARLDRSSAGAGRFYGLFGAWGAVWFCGLIDMVGEDIQDRMTGRAWLKAMVCCHAGIAERADMCGPCAFAICPDQALKRAFGGCLGVERR